jgi:membrane-associated phospholipid phosphatase
LFPFRCEQYRDRVTVRPRTLLLACGACLLGLALTGVLAYASPVAHVRDAATLRGFVALNGPEVTGPATAIAHLAGPLPFALLGLALAALAAARGRPRVALAILAILLGASVTAEALKPLLAHPRFAEWLGAGQIRAASWPSGHATAAMALGLCGVLAAPRRWRPLAAALGGGFAIAVAYAVLVLAWHFPSDVIGGFLVAATWALGVLAALAALERRRPSRAAAEPAAGMVPALAPLAVAAAAGAAAVAVAAARPEAARAFALAHPTSVVGAAAIAGAAAALAAVLARAAR